MSKPDFSRRSFSSHGLDQIQSLEGQPLASFRRRSAAMGLDLVFVFLLWLPFAIGIAVAMALGKFGFDPHPHGAHTVTVNEGIGEWMFVPIALLYFALFHWRWDGYTPGKRLLRIRVRSLHHDHISLWIALERFLGYGASMLEFGFGFLQYYLHPNRQTVHDRIAETIVVRIPKLSPTLASSDEEGGVGNGIDGCSEP